MIEVRYPDFGIDFFEKYYAKNNPLLTHFINSLHVVFPEGEKFFIRTVKKFKVDDADLNERIKGFVGQEIQHMQQHKKLWDVLRIQEVDVDDFNKWYSKNAYKTIEGTIYKVFGDDLGKRIALATTVALEHYTATLAKFALNPEYKLLEDFNPKMRALLEWHCKEEIEHQDVAFDIMKSIGENELIKDIGMIIATLALFIYSTIGTVKFIKEDSKLKINLDHFVGIPSKFSVVTNFTIEILKYFRFDFKPT